MAPDPNNRNYIMKSGGSTGGSTAFSAMLLDISAIYPKNGICDSRIVLLSSARAVVGSYREQVRVSMTSAPLSTVLYCCCYLIWLRKYRAIFIYVL